MRNLALKLYKKNLAIKPLEAVDDKLTRIDYVPPLGSLITTKEAKRWITGFAMGISNGKRGVFLSEGGLIHLPFDVVNYSWIKET